jgi:hypothetical protein
MGRKRCRTRAGDVYVSASDRNRWNALVRNDATLNGAAPATDKAPSEAAVQTFVASKVSDSTDLGGVSGASATIAPSQRAVRSYVSSLNPTGTALGKGDLIVDAWGTQKVSLPYSLFHGLWTFDIPASMWFMYENGTQVYTSSLIISTGGYAQIATQDAVTSAKLESRVCPRYQPNRGGLFSTAVWCPEKTANAVREWGIGTIENRICFRLKSDGLLYAVRRTNNSDAAEQVIDTSGLTGFDVQKNNIYDIQMQWRGAGNYNFFIGDPATGALRLVHQFALLGTLTGVSVQNPALPIYFSVTSSRTAAVYLNTGCADLSSENGRDLVLTPNAAFANAVAVSSASTPVLIIHNPLQIGTPAVTNTRPVFISRFTFSCAKKTYFRVWMTRVRSNITGGTFADVGAGSFIQCDSPDINAAAVRATSVNTANMRALLAIQVEAGTHDTVSASGCRDVNLDLVRGDYLVITTNTTNSTADAVIEWGEYV